ncbi:hypothetical protein FACS1894189_3980 [Planctomycetales bacterium]|nr:hypothetical protein FACS1894189_3980 [Planctomycetales bacterium]
MEADNNDAKVGIEVCADVSLHYPDGSKKVEEDKSSLIKNPLTNRSNNLWKTFFNWVSMVNEGKLNTDIDRVVLYANHQIPADSLVKQFHNVKTQTEADDIVSEVQKIMSNVNQKQEIFKYIDFILNKNPKIFTKILLCFELVEDKQTDNVYDNIRNFFVNKMLIPEHGIEYLLESITGWLQKTIMERIAKDVPAIISKEELKKHISPLLESIRKKELIDYAISKMPTPQEQVRIVGESPTYVRQLEIIELTQDDILEAVSDYFRADTNRQEWIERGIIDEDAMKDFEKRLCDFHHNHNKHISLTNKDLTEEERGQLLLADCQNRQEQIANNSPPARTIHGTYHVLSDEEKLGWHSHWREILQKHNGG